MNDFNIRITRREGEVEQTIDIDCYKPLALAAEPLLVSIAAPEPATKLEWSKTLCDGKRVNHAAAVKACAELGEGWRLSTITELLSLVDYTRYEPAIDVALYPDTKSGSYWTSTVHASDSSYAWVVDFDNGYSASTRRDGNNAFVRAVRAVRSLPAGQ